MKLFLTGVLWVLVVIGLTFGAITVANATPQDKITICHAAGLDDTTHYITLTIGYNAVYGPAGHFYENGTPQAGHEQDYLGACEGEEEPQLHKYRVVAGMPRYRGQSFLAEDGLVCSTLETSRRHWYWLTICGGHQDKGILLDRTYVRLRDLTDGSMTVLLDRR